MPSKPRILIADDHQLVAECCRQLLTPEFDVVGVVSNGEDLVSTAVTLKPDLAFVDIGMPVLNGIEAASRVKAALPRVKIVYLTMMIDAELALAALDRGGSGFVLKNCAGSELVLAVRKALRGETYICSLLKTKVADLRCAGVNPVLKSDRLTERQRQVLQLIAEGSNLRQVASKLGMSARTAAFHKYRIMHALGARSNADLVRFAVRNRMVAARS